MSFFYDLNKKLDSIRAMPEVTHQQLNERDEGKPGKMFNKIAKDAGERYGSKAAGERVAGSIRNKLRDQGKLEEDSPYKGDVPISDPVNKNYKPPAAGSQIKVAPMPQIKVAPAPQPTVTNKLPSTGAGAGRGGQGGAGAPEPSMLDKIGTAVGNAGKAVGKAIDSHLDANQTADEKYRQQADQEYRQDVIDQNLGRMKEGMSRAAKGWKKYGDGMIELSQAAKNGASENEMDAIRKKNNKYDDKDDLNELSVNKLLRVKHDANALARDERMSGGNADMAAKAERVAGKAGNQAHDKTAADMKAQGRPNLPEAGDTPAGLAAVKKVGQRADRRIQDAGTGRSDSELANPDKAYATRDRANAIQNRERIRANDKNPTRVVGGPNHGNQMEEGGGIPMTPKQKSFAALAPPDNKITFADRIAGAKHEVDEMLGNVAADAMKKAIGGGRGRNAEMDEGHFDDTPTRRRSSSGGEIDTSKPGSTVHRAVKGNYSGAVHSGEERRANQQADAADERAARAGRRPVGAGQGTKIGAKINRGTSKLVNKPAIGASGKPKSMTKENDQDPADQGEYDQEGAMGRNEIHTMMRNAKQLEQMLGDNDNLPEWVQKKLSLASDYMQTIADYLASERETDAEDQSGEEGMELAEKKSVRTKPKLAKRDYDNDGNRETGPEEHAGSVDNAIKKAKKPSFAKKGKEEEVDESTTAGSMATAPTSGKAGKGSMSFGKGSMSFGKGIYDSIDRAVERQINESMNISMSMNTDGGGAGQTLTITATDEDASQLAQILKMAGLGGGDNMSHGGEEVCPVCGMSDCGCGNMEQMDEGSGTVNKMIKFMQNRLGTSAEKAASDAAADAYMAANGEVNFRKLIDKLESDPAKYKYTGSPKTTRLPYMGPPKDIEDPAASAFKSYYEPGTATPTNSIPTIDKPPQMRRSKDRPAFDQSVKQTTVRDPFDPLVDESYGDNVVDMNSPNYPTNTEQAENNFGYSGGLNKPKRDVAGNGQTTVPVTAVRGQDNDFQESIQRMREIAGIKETPSIFFPDPKDTAKQLGIKAQSRLIDTQPPMSTGSNRSYNNTFLDPAQKAQQRLSKQNESIFTDTENLWKRYKG